MKLFKKVLIIISVVWTIISLGLITYATLIDPPSCAVNDNEPVAELTDDLPEFKFELMDENSRVTNESIKGQYTMLYFWGTSCSICVKEMPYLHETYEKLKDENFEIIAVSYDKSEKKVRKFMDEEYPMPWKHTVLGDDRESARKTFNSFGFQGSPYKVIVSPEGKVLDTFNGFSGEDLLDKVKKHVNSAG